MGEKPVKDHRPANVKEGLGFLVEHYTGNIGAVHAAVRRPCYVYLVALKRVRINEVLPEPHKLLRYICLVLGGYFAHRKASTDGLVNPHDIREFVPTLGIVD